MARQWRKTQIHDSLEINAQWLSRKKLKERCSMGMLFQREKLTWVVVRENENKENGFHF